MIPVSLIQRNDTPIALQPVVLRSNTTDAVVRASRHVWQAEQYHYNSSAQKDAAFKLLSMISLRGDEAILDVGCGDGKITKKIADLVPQGSVQGSDISPEMIDFAQKTFPHGSNANLTFTCQDGQQIDFHEAFDAVFSSFAIQWMKDKDSFFCKARACLKADGYLAATIPLGISTALEETIREIISLPEWASYFDGFAPGWHFVNDEEYARLLSVHQFAVKRLAIIPQDAVFPSRGHLESYVLQWFSYLRPLPEELRDAFFKQVMDRYFELEPISGNGEAHLKFERLEIIASKT